MPVAPTPTPPPMPVDADGAAPATVSAPVASGSKTVRVIKSAPPAARVAATPGGEDDAAGSLGDAPAEDAPDPFAPPPKIPFAQQKWVQNVLPLATSLAFHVGLIVIGIATYKAVAKVVSVVKEQIIIPESTLADNGPPGGITHPGLGNDPTRDAAQDLEKNTPQDSQSWQTKASNNLSQAVMGAAAGDTQNTSVIGIGANAAVGSKSASGIMGGGEASGSLSPFGVPGGGGGMGPKSSFIGLGGNARKVLYFCDASGSMVPVFGQLRVELKKSIDGLKPIQAFNVVFYSDDKIFPLSQSGLVVANPDNKRKAYDFIDNQVASGGTQPIPAIKFALAEKPQLMYLLTDGFDQIADFSQVTDAFKQGNPDHAIKINCIYLQSDDDPKLVQVLKEIAHDNGGLMKIISKNDF